MPMRCSAQWRRKGDNFKQLQEVHGLIGYSVGPDDVFLALRGLRTMPTRMKQHQHAALDIAAWLQSLSFVRKIYYPRHAGRAGP
jgi:cystathionine beta-lyase